MIEFLKCYIQCKVVNFNFTLFIKGVFFQVLQLVFILSRHPDINKKNVYIPTQIYL